MKEHIFYVKGMHCASCEILIEKRLLELKGVKSAEASTCNGQVLIECDGGCPNVEELNALFKNDHYSFSETPPQKEESAKGGHVLATAIAVIVGFFLLNRLGLSSWVNVGSDSSLPVFFFLGIVAGLSSCAALVGGLVLSMSKQWLGLYGERSSAWKKFQPHLMFNVGRLISYGLLGAILGDLGSKLQISLGFTSFLALAISVLMLILGAQMLGIKSLRSFQFTMPKFITRRVADESKFQGRYMPFILGAFTFFLPCGFTITAQGLALISGSAIQGGLIMFLFAMGTLPMLLTIGLSSVKFSQKPHLSERFLKVAGVLVLFFALYNINFQLNVLGITSLSDLGTNSSRSSSTAKNNSFQKEEGLPPIVNGKQILKMDASSRGYSPSYLKVKVGIPVRWEIIDKGTSGCTNAIISRNLFEGEIPLTPGQTSVKEFTPEKPGKYKFSCWMGMVSGIIEVIDESGAAFQDSSLNSNGNLFSPSGVESSGGS